MSSAEDGLRGLEQRLRRLEDRAAIEDLAARYFVACDDRDYATLRSLFARDAVYSGAHGPDEITAMLRASRESMGPTVHTPDFVLLERLEKSSASGFVAAHCELARGGKTVFGALRYLDAYVREDGAWKFRSRQTRYFHVGPWEDVASSLTERLRKRWPEADPAPAELPEES